MEISLSPTLVQQELANLDNKKSDKRKSAMEVLKLHVKGLDCKAIPLFLSQVSTTKLETSSLSAVLRISLCEVVVRVHRRKIVPLIDTIMTTIINTLALASGAAEGSFLLQLACFRVVLAIAKYGVDPNTSPGNKMRIIKSLCDPLYLSLSGFSSLVVHSNIECLGSGAALCLRAVVDSNHWRIASDDMVEVICIHVDSALQRYPNQTNAYMSLIMALAKRNATVVEIYVLGFIRIGLKILNDGVAEENGQKQLWAIRTIYFLLKHVSHWISHSRLQLIIEEMELRHFDRMDYIREAAFEAWYMAKRIAETEFKKGPGSVTSNFSLREHSWRRQRIRSNGISRSTTTSPPRSRFPINFDSNICIKTPRMLVRSLSLNGSLHVDGDNDSMSSTNDLPGDSPNDLPGDSANDHPGDSANDLPGDSANDHPGDSANDLPGDSANDLPGVLDVQVYSLKVVYEGIIERFRSFIASKFGFDLLIAAVFFVVAVALGIWYRLPNEGRQFLPPT